MTLGRQSSGPFTDATAAVVGIGHIIVIWGADIVAMTFTTAGGAAMFEPDAVGMAVKTVCPVFSSKILMALLRARPIVPVVGGPGMTDLTDAIPGQSSISKGICAGRTEKLNGLVSAVRGLDR